MELRLRERGHGRRSRRVTSFGGESLIFVKRVGE